MSSTAIPCLRYRNAPEAIELLCRIFGFEKHLIVPGPGNTIRHSQLKLGGGMIMVGSIADEEDRSRMTSSPYIVVADADAVYARAKQAGWKITVDIHDEEYGGRGFGCQDQDGHNWYAGTYNPWA